MPLNSEPKSVIDPNAKGSSGCTAVAALVTNDNKIYVVCDGIPVAKSSQADPSARQMQAIQDR